ncbi:MAG: hypothetical protein C5B47_06440 [Verrucomicrobia bacterium]|nr:MAG: hypothetical protein C5B47_06440 [Verrucomicrobiota bacterium]
MFLPFISPLICLAPLIVLAGVLACNFSVRESLRYGWRCLKKYPDLWRIPILFTLGYAVFNILAYSVVPKRMGIHFNPWRDPDPNAPWIGKAITETFWPAAENMSGVYNYLIVTFPLSALIGLAYLINFSGIRVEFQRAVFHRFPRLGYLIAWATALTAFAALIKPVFFLALYPLVEKFSGWDVFRTGNAVGVLAFLFEYLLATFLQVYLVLMAFAWIRGLSFERGHLLHFSLRRLGYVLKWIALISLPGFLVLAGSFFFLNTRSYITLNNLVQSVVIPIFTIFTLFMSSVQITLTLHNESLHQAIADHFHFLRTHFRDILLFTVVGILLFWELKILLYAIQRSFGIYTITGISAELIEAALRGLLGGWLLASWVCLYRHWSKGKAKSPF